MSKYWRVVENTPLLINAIFFLFLMYQLYIHMTTTIMEGLENEEDDNEEEEATYIEYDTSKSSILEQQNAGNIAYLKQRFADIQPNLDNCSKMQIQLDNLQTQFDDMATAQQEYTSTMVGDEPPDITGVE